MEINAAMRTITMHCRNYDPGVLQVVAFYSDIANADFNSICRASKDRPAKLSAPMEQLRRMLMV